MGSVDSMGETVQLNKPEGVGSVYTSPSLFWLSQRSSRSQAGGLGVTEVEDLREDQRLV